LEAFGGECLGEGVREREVEYTSDSVKELNPGYEEVARK
jgi:hypothetical protein